MEWYWVIACMVAAICTLMMLGLPVAFAFLGANIFGAFVFMGGIEALGLVAANAVNRVAVFTLVPIPMFLLMGELFFRTGLAIRVFDAFDLLLGRLPGRLAFLTVAGGTFFSSLTGSSIANSAMLGTLLLPEMKRRGYKSHMAMGPILGTGGLAMIIPPSGLAVLLGSLANLDIGALLIAGVVPGVLLAILYTSAILIQLKIDPSAAPAYDTPGISATAKLHALAVNVLPMGLVIFSVVGLILLGWATPTESAAFGAASVIVLAALSGKLTWTVWTASLNGTIRVTGMIFMIIVGSSTFSQILAYTGATSEMIAWASNFDVAAVVLVVMMFFALLFLGTFMDQASMLMLCVPIFYPIIHALGLDPIWFGLILLLGLEMGLTTPPFGMILFVMLGVAPKGTTLWQVARAALPFLGCDAICVAAIIAFPGIVLYLPGLIVR